MNKSLESTLSGLIPEFTGPIPTELVNLANSFLIQSRQRVSNLKPEEEPARSYLCAQLACERLKKKLDLPKIQPNPPLPKKAYSLLYKQFQNALSGSGSGGAIAIHNRRVGASTGLRSKVVAIEAEESHGDDAWGEGESSITKHSRRGQHAKKTSPLPMMRAGSTSSTRKSIPIMPGNGVRNEEDGEQTTRQEGLDKETYSKIHSLCTNENVNAINAIPYIISGLRVLLSLHNKKGAGERGIEGSLRSSNARSRRMQLKTKPSINTTSASAGGGDDHDDAVVASTGSTPNLNINAMLTTLYIVVSASLLGKPLDGSDISKTQELALGILSQGSGGPTNGDRKAVEEEMTFILESEEGMGWIGCIPKGGGITGGPQPISAHAGEAAEIREDGDVAREIQHPYTSNSTRKEVPMQAKVKRRNHGDSGETGIGTMMQERVNYTSAKRMENYAEWKKRIMKRVEEIERRRAKQVATQ